MIWGCMIYNGLGYMCKIQGTVDQHLYIKILREELQETIKYFDLNPKIIFQQDNASCHKASMVSNWLKSQPFDVLQWPAQSPDLNPIETLWAIIKCQLNEYETPPSGLLELWDHIEHIWNEISPDTCRKLIESMPKRIEAVLKARGKWTNF